LAPERRSCPTHSRSLPAATRVSVRSPGGRMWQTHLCCGWRPSEGQPCAAAAEPASAANDLHRPHLLGLVTKYISNAAPPATAAALALDCGSCPDLPVPAAASDPARAGAECNPLHLHVTVGSRVGFPRRRIFGCGNCRLRRMPDRRHLRLFTHSVGKCGHFCADNVTSIVILRNRDFREAGGTDAGAFRRFVLRSMIGSAS